MSLNDAQIEQALQQAITHHQAGRRQEAEQLYRQILQAQPRHAEANYNLGGLAMEAGQPAIGLPHLQAALEADPNQAVYWLSFAEALLIANNAEGARGVLEQAMQRGLSGPAVDQLMAQIQKSQPARSTPTDANALYQAAMQHHHANRLIEAAALYQQFIALQPKNAEAHNNLGVALQGQGRLDEAIESYRRALAVKKNYDNALNNLGNALKDQGKLEEAVDCFRKALAVTPKSSQIQYNLGNALKDLGKTDEAVAAYRRAAGLTPDFAWAHNNLGGLLVQQGKPDEAIPSIRRALSLQPDFAEAHNNLGNALKDQGKLDEAMASYRQAIAVKPDYAEAHLHLGNVLCDSGDIDAGFAACTRSAELKYADPPGEPPPPPHKTQHDREQRDYLAGQGIMAGNRLRLADGERLTTPAVNPDNTITDIDQQWRNNRPQVVVIDNLLTEEALTKLRKFCWGSTMWRRVYSDGYLGAFPESGFTSPLLAQIGEELRQTYPAIFGGHPLLYAWAFKYDSTLRGIRLHADFAAVNVNFWITPDEANLNPESGGLVVWDVAAPLDWDFAKFNSIDTTHARDFLDKAGAKSMTVPYRSNRAVIFDSDLFHETDQISFKEGYQNRRINVTLLYGRRANS